MQRAAESADPRIVNQDIHSAERRLDALRSSLHRLETGYIAWNDLGLATGIHDGFGGRIERRTGASAEHSCGAQICERACDGGANPPACARNDCYLPNKKMSFIVGERIHERPPLVDAAEPWRGAPCHPPQVASASYTMAGRETGKLLAFGRRGTYNPANRERRVIRLQPSVRLDFAGPARNATWISRQDAERVSDPSGMPQTQQERYFTTLSIPKDARSQY